MAIDCNQSETQDETYLPSRHPGAVTQDSPKDDIATKTVTIRTKTVTTIPIPSSRPVPHPTPSATSSPVPGPLADVIATSSVTITTRSPHVDTAPADDQSQLR